ncbi:GntR family transcriptional regulator [Sphingomonas sp. H39-1-10]|uniref:GntR family transcriptional regulator n=1 Tax=Sphingomonas TaxID=13687 RepID=UPI00088D8039|nr:MULTISPECIES: GntR family transcriptional regulator [Sphingomonas]MDF0487150.1 GntR family transcriptional regulator [Sphingomonas pollutisoli]SDA25985.1 DNA-binding transcriptional regulator, GntR family [Sphingomonas sp. NFR15]
MRAATRKATREPPGASLPDPAGGDDDTSLADKAYGAILRGLFDRSIPSGAELSQADLIRLLGMTAQPLRDALRRLETEGLVTIHARSCIRFVRADLELSRSTYQFRTLIERGGARILAERGDADEIQALVDDHHALLARLESPAWSPDEKAALDALEDRLHGALISALRNELIENTARRLKNYVTLVRLDWLTTRPLAIRTLREHLEILNACVARDADAAEAALVAHFQLALQRLIGME